MSARSHPPVPPDHAPATSGAPGHVPETGHALLRVAAAGPPATPLQAEFNRLVALIDGQRRTLADWQAAQDDCARRAITDLEPERRKLLALQRQVVLWIDGFLNQPLQGDHLAKKPRQRLVYLLLTLAREVLRDGPDDEIEAAHDRHAVQGHAEHQRQREERTATLLRQFMGDPDLFEGEPASVAELLRRASERMPPRDGRAEASPDPPTQDQAYGGTSPADRASAARRHKAQQRDARAQQEAAQSVREVYRRLASTLHPDRESDPVQRDRKTQRMARVNAAYEHGDLLALLTVQREVEQLAPGHRPGLPDRRLKHHCRVLKDQLTALEAHTRQITGPLAFRLGMPHARVKPGDLRRLLDQDIATVRLARKHLAQDFDGLRTPALRPACLRELEIDDPDRAVDPAEAMLAFRAHQEATPSAAATPPRRGRRRR